MAVNKKLVKELQEAKENLKDMQASKSGKKINKLETRLEDLEKVNAILQNRILDVEEENRKLIENQGTVSKADYEGLIKQIEKEKKLREQIQKLFDGEKEKRITDKEKALTEIGKYKQLYNDSLIKIAQYENKINITSKSGRKRKSSISDEDIISMNKNGKSLRGISKETGLSINTIRGILKSVSK